MYPTRQKRDHEGVLLTPSGWAAQLHGHLGNFCGWKDHDAYQAAVAQLLRDMKAKGRSSITGYTICYDSR